MGARVIVELGPPWADLVFHVLSHVPSAVPASVYDREYAAFAASVLGSPGARELGADAATLSQLAHDPARFAALQSLAWLFLTAAQALRSIDRDLAELGAADVADPEALGTLVALGPEAELLRSACELEAEHHARLPPAVFAAEELAARLGQVCAAAPGLASCRLFVIRSLGRRGRVRGREIWIGAPFPGGGPDLGHLAFQAAHEATVGELVALEGATSGDDRPLEAAALVLLQRRAERAGLGEAHARWLAHFGERPDVELSALTPSFRDRVRSLLAG